MSKINLVFSVRNSTEGERTADHCIVIKKSSKSYVPRNLDEFFRVFFPVTQVS